jgi:hypothetical protein
MIVYSNLQEFVGLKHHFNIMVTMVIVTYLIHILYLLLIKTNINKDFLLEEHLYDEYI